MSPPGRVVILGQGYVGLPFAMRAAEAGFDVVGFDVDTERVEHLARGESFIEDIDDATLRSHLDSGRYRPSADVADIEGFDIAVISVPTPLRDGLPDIAYIEQASDMVGPFVRPGCCVVLESTTYPGTTVDVVAPRLAAASGLRPGDDFAVGYSPERIDPGNDTWTFRNTPKIVSGIDAASLDAVDEFYSALVDTTVRVKGTKEAELAKLLENTFRHVNIALVNELAICAHDLEIDVWDVIEAAGSKPFGFMKFTPGPGVGGHCLPVDPSYLSWQVRRALGRSFRFVELANDINEHMPDYVVQRVNDRFNRERRSINGSRILAVGAAYKQNTADARESPALDVIARLKTLGADVVVADPLVDQRHLPAGIEVVKLDAAQLEEADLVLVLTAHDAFDWDAIEAVSHKVFDTRRRLGSSDAEVI